MPAGRQLLVVVSLLWTVTACGTGGRPNAEAPAAVVSVAPTPVEAGTRQGPPARPWSCGPRSNPRLVAGPLRITGVDPEDAQIITALARQYTSVPLLRVGRRHGLVEAWAECCSPIPDDCTILVIRFDKTDGAWNVVGTSQIIQ